ncbi:hypothetical protein BDV96DRAFT_81446 [Lophiotrema nucula]|uniref:Uncharacterized protein n=1 Tax=Lophiotrema nucula TaxID=690887 RepID=A0A6A5Z7V1_9PLEO|nr:hypothetical protein BDV96DRAFT_81446 [Lophiotrema nucula]
MIIPLCNESFWESHVDSPSFVCSFGSFLCLATLSHEVRGWSPPALSDATLADIQAFEAAYVVHQRTLKIIQAVQRQIEEFFKLSYAVVAIVTPSGSCAQSTGAMRRIRGSWDCSPRRSLSSQATIFVILQRLTYLIRIPQLSILEGPWICILFVWQPKGKVRDALP